MSAKKTEEPKAEPQEPAAPTKQEVAIPRPGEIVLFYKNIQTQTGNKLEEFPALVLGYPKVGANFQKKDMALDLKVFSCRDGGADEVRHGVLYSSGKTAQRWTFR